MVQHRFWDSRLVVTEAEMLFGLAKGHLDDNTVNSVCRSLRQLGQCVLYRTDDKEHIPPAGGFGGAEALRIATGVRTSRFY